MREMLIGKTLTNHQPFVKFTELFHHQYFALHNINCYMKNLYTIVNIVATLPVPS